MAIVLEISEEAKVARNIRNFKLASKNLRTVFSSIPATELSDLSIRVNSPLRQRQSTKTTLKEGSNAYYFKLTDSLQNNKFEIEFNIQLNGEVSVYLLVVLGRNKYEYLEKLNENKELYLVETNNKTFLTSEIFVELIKKSTHTILAYSF